jgi:hypothetical protein
LTSVRGALNSGRRTDILRLEYVLASEAMTKKRPPLNTTSLWFIESRAAEKLLREARKKKRKKT